MAKRRKSSFVDAPGQPEYDPVKSASEHLGRMLVENHPHYKKAIAHVTKQIQSAANSVMKPGTFGNMRNKQYSTPKPGKMKVQ